jgi:hypothetical protein
MWLPPRSDAGSKIRPGRLSPLHNPRRASVTRAQLGNAETPELPRDTLVPNLDSNRRRTLTQSAVLAMAAKSTRDLFAKWQTADKSRKEALAATHTAEYQAAFVTTARLGSAYAAPWMLELDAKVGAATRAERAALRALDEALLSDAALWAKLSEAHRDAEVREAAALVEYTEAGSRREFLQAAGRALRPLSDWTPPEPADSYPSVEAGFYAAGHHVSQPAVRVPQNVFAGDR